MTQLIPSPRPSHFLIALALVLPAHAAQAEEVEVMPAEDVERAAGSEDQPAPIEHGSDPAERTQAPEVDLEVVPSTQLAAGSSRRAYEEPTFEYQTTRRTYPNVPLLVTSTTVFAASYVPALVGAAVSERDDDDLYVPVAGPWLSYANGPSETSGQKALLVVNGVAQGLGALGLISSFFVPQSRTKDWYLIGNADFHVDAAGAGVRAAGRF